MKYNRMSTADMLQYCEEALAWEDFGPVDIYFFESVKRILLGQCSAAEEQEDAYDDLMGIERPVSDKELEPEYHKYADIYYNEEGDDEIPDYSISAEDVAFSDDLFGNGFFEAPAGDDKLEHTLNNDRIPASQDTGRVFSAPFAAGTDENSCQQQNQPEVPCTVPAKTDSVENNSENSEEKTDAGKGFIVNL